MAVEAGGIGARLRAGREKLGLTVLQVAERIHTDPKIVEAIEADNFEALGAPVYARGHIGHYAELVGESGSELNQLYSHQSKVAQPDLTRIVKAPVGTDSSKLVAPALLVLAVFAVAGAIWWVSALSKKKPQMSETHVVGDETPASASAASPADSSTALEGASVPGGAIGSSVQGGAPGASARTGGPTSPADRGPPAGAMAMQPRPVQPPASTVSPAHSASAPAATMAMQAPPASTSASVMSMQQRPGGTSGGGTTAGSTTAGSAAPTPPRSATAVSQATTSARARSTKGSGSASAPTGSAHSAPTSQSTHTASAQPHAAAAQTRTAFASPTRPAAVSAAAASAPETTTPAAAPPRAKNQSQVTLRYSSDSWTEVYDASGARLFYDVGAANSVKTVVGTPPLRVVLGNASGVSVEYNGHSKPIAKLSRPDGSVQFSINRSGQVVRAKPVADGG
jgi:cytoskeletal protein RodZ